MQCLRWEGDFCKGVDAWFNRNWGSKYNAKSWALGSETASTLFWRMLNGDGKIKDAGVKVVLIYIGSNNFGQARQDDSGQEAAGEELFGQVKDMTNWVLSQVRGPGCSTDVTSTVTGRQRGGFPAEPAAQDRLLGRFHQHEGQPRHLEGGAKVQ